MIRLVKFLAWSLAHTNRSANASLIYYLLHRGFGASLPQATRPGLRLIQPGNNPPKLLEVRTLAPALFIGPKGSRTRPLGRR